MAAIVDRSPLLVAIPTAGTAPRARTLPARFGELARIARKLRPDVARPLAPARRRYLWESALQGPAAELVFAGRDEKPRALIRSRLAAERDDRSGEVYLVATPPSGGVEAFTLRALRLLQRADVVIQDGGLAQPVLDLIRRGAERRPTADRAPAEVTAGAERAHAPRTPGRLAH